MAKKRILFSVGLLIFCCAFVGIHSAGQTAPSQVPALAITTESLPQAALQQMYRFRLQATGGIPPFHWSVRFGELPPGLELEDSGMISGAATKLGDYRFTVTLTDSSEPPQRTHKQFVITVVAPLLLDWSRPPRVQDNRIDGSVKVTNGTQDNFDLTVIVVGVDETGKAFALGYQRLDMKAGTANFEIPFGSTLPRGAYVVHADAVAEVPSRYAIFRRHLQTPSPLQIALGP